jgi:hypothetical protein
MGLYKHLLKKRLQYTLVGGAVGGLAGAGLGYMMLGPIGSVSLGIVGSTLGVAGGSVAFN